MTRIRLKPGEHVDRALRKLKKKNDQEAIMKESRKRRYHEKPSVMERKKSKIALKYKRKYGGLRKVVRSV